MMADKSIQMKHSNENGEWDNLYPITLTSNVYNLDGDSVDNIITKVKNDHDEDINNISNELNTLKNDHDEDINNISNELSTFKNNTNQRLDKLDNSVPNNHYVSTGFNSLQEAIFAAEGGTLYIEKGTYTITQP